MKRIVGIVLMVLMVSTVFALEPKCDHYVGDKIDLPQMEVRQPEPQDGVNHYYMCLVNDIYGKARMQKMDNWLCPAEQETVTPEAGRYSYETVVLHKERTFNRDTGMWETTNEETLEKETNFTVCDIPEDDFWNGFVEWVRSMMCRLWGVNCPEPDPEPIDTYEAMLARTTYSGTVDAEYEDDQTGCEATGGQWLKFDYGCADKCSVQTIQAFGEPHEGFTCGVYSIPRWSCDCGEGKCWNMVYNRCEDFVEPIQEPTTIEELVPLMTEEFTYQGIVPYVQDEYSGDRDPDMHPYKEILMHYSTDWGGYMLLVDEYGESTSCRESYHNDYTVGGFEYSGLVFGEVGMAWHCAGNHRFSLRAVKIQDGSITAEPGLIDAYYEHIGLTP